MLRNVLKLERIALRNVSTSLFSLMNRDEKKGFVKDISKKDCLNEHSDPDIFGTLSKNRMLDTVLERMPPEEGDKVEISYLDGIEGKVRFRTKQYADMIKKMVKENRIADALDVLETRMIKEDNVQPENYIYNLLIAATSNVGYTKKAFQLFNQMKKRGLKVTGATYTSLFNGCAKSPWKSDGLLRATHLRDLIKQKGYILNQSNYHAMIKAFGHCGDISTAFSLVDEMIFHNVSVTSDTINFLLQACISDKDAGFRHALIVWRKLVEKGITPSAYTYNLMLRCVRDCGLGDLETAQKSIQQIVGETQGLASSPSKLLIAGEVIEGNKSNDILSRVYSSSTLCSTNLLKTHPTIGTTFMNLKLITKPKQRLMLLGGCVGFLEQMALDKVKPDIKTITQLLDVIPSTLEAENVLLDTMAKHGMQVDIDFFNMLILKRSKRNCSNDAKEVLKLIRFYQLTPNIYTYGVLALSCNTAEEIEQILTDITENGFRLNIEILGSLLRSAVHIWDIKMVLKLMELVLKEELKPNEHFMDHLKGFHDFVQEEIKIKDKGGHPHKKLKDKYFIDTFQKFCFRYKEWKKQVTPFNADNIHPWDQFRNKESKKCF